MSIAAVPSSSTGIREMTGLIRGRKCTRGQSLVEFALVLPLLVLVVLGTFDFGRAIFAFNSVSNAARTAARVAIVDQTPNAIELAARDEAVALDSIAVSVTYTNGATTCSPVVIGCVATVRVQHTYSPATPLIGNIVGSTTLSSTAKMPVERAYSSP